MRISSCTFYWIAFTKVENILQTYQATRKSKEEKKISLIACQFTSITLYTLIWSPEIKTQSFHTRGIIFSLYTYLTSQKNLYIFAQAQLEHEYVIWMHLLIHKGILYVQYVYLQIIGPNIHQTCIEATRRNVFP